MTLICSFKCYVSDGGIDEIRRTYLEAQKQTKAKFFSRLKILSQLDFEEWHELLYKELHGDCVGLGEIRFFSDKVQQRPLGFRSGPKEFTILFWAREKGNKFVPLNACRKALERKAEVLKLKERSRALWLALE